MDSADYAAAYGRVREFWAKVRHKWVGTRYFCWLELTAKGRVHYHCVWLNPPHVKRVNLLAWVHHAWGGARTRTRFSEGRRGIQREVEYAIGYAKKMGKKSYQQRYDEVPRELRTFMSQRLEIPPHVLDEHRDTELWQYQAEMQLQDAENRGVTRLIEATIRHIGQRLHVVPPGGRCDALDYRRLKRGPPSSSGYLLRTDGTRRLPDAKIASPREG